MAKHKQQMNCYRNINGRRYTNYQDLAFSDEENAAIVKKAKELYRYVRVVASGSGTKQCFVCDKRGPGVYYNNKLIDNLSDSELMILSLKIAKKDMSNIILVTE